jgi:hypothetical protein
VDARERSPVAIRLGRRRTPSALGYLERRPAALPEEHQGIAISTLGKVIKRGWDWLGLTPAASARMVGLIEAPDLAACLTLSKSDFIRAGTRGAVYLAYRKAIQEVVSRQLTAWGDARDEDGKPRPQRLERDLARVLEDLADDFPLLRSLVDRRPGRQKRLPMPGRGREQAPGPLLADVASPAHPAYSRAVASRSTGYHVALSVALALAPLAIGSEGEHAFITQFLAHWGDASSDRPRRGRRRR